jgi:hypothetical protein
MAIGTGYLTIFSADRQEIYGEFVDAEWRDEKTDKGVNHILSGKASEGTLSAFEHLDQQGISNVFYQFEQDGKQFDGRAQLLAPKQSGAPGETIIQIESLEASP